LRLYLTDFLKYAFLRENAKNRVYHGVEKSTAACIYQAVINHPVAP